MGNIVLYRGWVFPFSSLKENAMFLPSPISAARPIGVLLGGSGLGQTATSPKRDVGALLVPRKSLTEWNESGSLSAGVVHSLWEIDHHD